MEWLKQMQAAMDYVEQHLDDKISIDQIAAAACSSPYHFQRMFYMLVGMTVGEYMRKRRLTLAAQELASTNARVLDVALKYGYDSPESFAKAFRKIHGIAPSQARAVGVDLKAFPRITFQIMLKGDEEVQYRIEDKEAFTINGKVLQTSLEDGANLREITAFWRECNQNGMVEKIGAVCEDDVVYGAIYDMVPGQDKFHYMIGARMEPDAVPGSLEELHIPASTWAIFSSTGPMPGAIQTLFHRIYQEWFPATGYEHAETPELEVYPLDDTTSVEYRCEVWIPIKKMNA